MMHVRLINSMTKEKQPIISDNKHISLYVCGITPYDEPHLGHGRCYVTFDIVYRLLTFLDYQVTYCRNFTDIDDKLLSRSEKEFGTPFEFKKIASRYIDIFNQTMHALHCKKPTYEPLVTETIPEIITFIEELIAHGNAYVVESDVYYSIDSFADYGKLSHRKLDDLCAGARVAVDERKKNPLDFALWKSEPEGHYYKSPWGYGRPGWHIECSAMSKKFLGNTLDIHGGGMDLLFPHHENEIAQSQPLQSDPFVKLWAHNAFVQVNKEKMSKSLGNFFSLRDIFKRCAPQAVRFYFLQHHYRNPLDFSLDDLENAQKAYKKLILYFTPFNAIKPTMPFNNIIDSMINFLMDDLNTPGMFGVLYKHKDEILRDHTLAGQVKYILHDILGLTLDPLPEKEFIMTSDIESLIKQREQARKDKNWELSDELRDKLSELGYEVKDSKLS